VAELAHKTAILRLSALAQDTRLAIFRLLVNVGKDGLTVGRIAEQLTVAPATLSFHLKELSYAQMIEARQESRYIYYSANFSAMNELLAFLSENCCGGLPCLVTADKHVSEAEPRSDCSR